MSRIGVDKIPTQSDFERAIEGSTDLNKKIFDLGKLNKLAYNDLFLSINTDSFFVFWLVQNAKIPEFLKGTCKVAWDRLLNKYAPHTAQTLLKLKSEFHNSKLDQLRKIQMNESHLWKGLEFEWANLVLMVLLKTRMLWSMFSIAYLKSKV